MASLSNPTIMDVTNKMALSVSSSTSDKNYFEEVYSWRPQMEASDIFAESVPYANNPTEADTNVTNNPTIIEKLVDYQLTEIPASNGQGYCLYETPGDASSNKLNNFILPQKYGVGYGFSIKSNGTLIPLTAGQYQFDYANGIIRFDPAATPSLMGWSNLTITLYHYIGKTLDTTSASSGGYTRIFTNSDLSGGMLTVDHNLLAKDNITHITIKDNNNKHINPDDIIDINQNRAVVDFRMLEPISGNWTIIVTAVTDDGSTPPVTIPPRTINSNTLNSSVLN